MGSASGDNTVSISGGGSCFFPQDVWLKKNVPTWTSYVGAPYDPQNLRSSNDLFQFPTMAVGASHTSSFIDLRSVHTLFVHSPSFWNYSCLAPRGVRTAITNIACELSSGAVLHAALGGSPFDYIFVVIPTLKFL